MDTIKFNDVTQFITSYLKRDEYSQPLHLCFQSNITCDYFRKRIMTAWKACQVDHHPVRGHKHMFYNDNIVLVKKHPELLRNTVMPENLMTRSSEYECVLFYTFLGQADMDVVDYPEGILKVTHLPVIYVTNDYQVSDRSQPGFDYLQQHYENVLVENEPVVLSPNGNELLQVSEDFEGEFIIPDSVKEIGAYAAHSCNRITSVIIQAGVESIGTQAFSFCNNISSVVLPQGLKEIGNHAFSNTALKRVIIPKTTQNIGIAAFPPDCIIEK